MLLSEYETTLVVRPDIGGDAIEATLDRVREAVSGQGGKLLSMDHWGKKKLAYPIRKHTRGIYVHATYLGQGPLVAEVERNLRIADSVLRFLTVQTGSEVDPEMRQSKEYVAPQYDAEEHAAAEEPAAEAAEEQEQKAAGEGEGGEEQAEAAAEPQEQERASEQQASEE